MYPSIPISYGLKAVRNVMTQFNYHIDKLDFILDLLEWVLLNNYLKFNNEIYLQINGTAMGTPIAVCYANITLYYLEQSCFATTNPICYKRYIDDLCVICINTEQAHLITKVFNQQVPTIQLTAITIDTSGIFLDLNLKINTKLCQIEFSLYQKDINKYLYIPPWSAHNQHILKNIINNEIRRIILINTCRINALSNIKIFRERLIDRGFTKNYLKPLFNAHCLPCRSDLLNKLFSPSQNNFNKNNNNNNDDNTSDNNNINNNNNKNSCSNLNNINNINNRPLIVTHLPKFLSTKSLYDIFKLPNEITNHNKYNTTYDKLTNIRIINSTTHNSINMQLNHKKDKSLRYD
jgi:hypothetical protein